MNIKNNKNTLRHLAEAGLIAAMYTALTLVVPAASFGLAQFRVAELLTILPVFTASAIPGLALGCAVSNLVGLTMGANIAGAWDILFGTLATLSAAYLTYRLRNLKWKGLPIAATIPPIVINAVVIGLELSFVLFPPSVPLYMINIAQVGLGQLAACGVCGLFLYSALNKSGAANAIFRK